MKLTMTVWLDSGAVHKETVRIKRKDRKDVIALCNKLLDNFGARKDLDVVTFGYFHVQMDHVLAIKIKEGRS